MNLKTEIISQISQYLKTEKKPLICVVGPTGSGKTKFAIEIIEKFGGELINADSRQIFKGIEKITGLDFEEIKNVKNHLFAVAEIEEKNWTAGKFLEEIRKIIEEIYLRKKIPILVGGTGLFISSLIEGFEMPKNSKSTQFREKFKEKTKEELFEELEKIDPETAKKLHKNNRNYVERALEIFYTTGGKKSEGKKNPKKAFNGLIFHKKIFTENERENLYKKINERQKNIFENSIKTVENLRKKIDFSQEFPALKSIGIKEISDFLDGENKEKEIENMQKKARNYAKRQMTWRRKKENIIFI